ncbi:hypothetical protein MCGE09_00558 [Thaumarchaeota archaeon SCGC AB-539-E09]|nr:hypothetical protein MCGE09_00558 [Thaumarchaeota archaeon SCGC AB-539-E09]
MYCINASNLYTQEEKYITSVETTNELTRKKPDYSNIYIESIVNKYPGNL